MEVLYDPERRWRSQGLCLGADPELFFAAQGQPKNRAHDKVQAKLEKAKEICHRCPVQLECQRDTLGEEYGVWGGLDEHERWLKRRRLPKQVPKWPWEQRQAWSRLFTDLRAKGATFRGISLKTGFSEPLIMKLMEELDKPAPEPPAEVVTLPAPKNHRPEWPKEAGRRHAWVRHQTQVADAFYISQTADGRWFHFKCFSGRGNVRKWFAAEDVLIYRPQAVVLAEYLGRPDEPGKPLVTKVMPSRVYPSTHCPQEHAYTAANTHYDHRGHRQCRACRRVRNKVRKEKDRAAAQSYLALSA